MTNYPHPFEERLTGRHPNSLGNTVEVVEEVLSDHAKFHELFQCYFSNDEVVRLKTSNAMKRICKEEKHLLVPYVDKFLAEISGIDQASTQWTLSQLFAMLKEEMTIEQIDQAKNLMQSNLQNHQDWIILNTNMETLAQWAKTDNELKEWLHPQLERLLKEPRKSISKHAKKLIRLLYE